MADCLDEKKYKSLAASLLNKTAGKTEDIISFKPLQGGNNRVYKIKTDQGMFVLKIYYCSGNDGQSRLLREYSFLEYAWNSGVRSIPCPVNLDATYNAAVYTYIDGCKLNAEQVGEEHVLACVDFICQINKTEHRKSPLASALNSASDACENIQDHINTVSRRLDRLARFSPKDDIDEKAMEFIKDILFPRFKETSEEINITGSIDKYKNDKRIISPSDFGFHNALVGRDSGQLFFIDFEYAGWDDPLKLVCDYFCQPETPVPMKYLDVFCDKIMTGFVVFHDFFDNVKSLLALYRLKWCCIMLNEFITDTAARREFAYDRDDRREQQLEKAIKYARKHL